MQGFYIIINYPIVLKFISLFLTVHMSITETCIMITIIVGRLSLHFKDTVEDINLTGKASVIFLAKPQARPSI